MVKVKVINLNVHLRTTRGRQQPLEVPQPFEKAGSKNRSEEPWLWRAKCSERTPHPLEVMICEGALLEFCPDGASNRSSQIKKLGKIIAGWVQVESYIWGLSTTGSHPRGGAEEQAGLPTIQVKIVIVVHKSSSGSCGLGLAVSGFSLGFPQMIPLLTFLGTCGQHANPWKWGEWLHAGSFMG